MKNIPKIILLKLISFYRLYLSNLKVTPTCRFIPTCSQYAYQAISKYGVIKGGYLSIKRILKCNPLFKGGYDPLK